MRLAKKALTFDDVLLVRVVIDAGRQRRLGHVAALGGARVGLAIHGVAIPAGGGHAVPIAIFGAKRFRTLRSIEQAVALDARRA